MPRLGHNKPQKVCLNCFDRLAKAAFTPSTNEPASVAVQSTSSNAHNLAAISADDTVSRPSNTDINPDNAIKERLRRLQADKQLPAATTDTEIAVRIANLKGQQYNERPTHDPAILLATDRRTDPEKTDDLLKQFAAETQLDERADPIADIERRLAALRSNVSAGTAAPAAGVSSAANSAAAVMDDVDETAQVDQLVARFMAEAALDSGDEAELELTAEELAAVASARAKRHAKDDHSHSSSSSATAESEPDSDASVASLEKCYMCDDDEVPLQRFRGGLICKWCLESKNNA